MNNFSIITFGCKVNQYESQQLREALAGQGFKEVASHQADISIINTCAVTVESQGKGRRATRRARRQNPSAFIIASGCSAAAFPEELRRAGAHLVEPDKEKVLRMLLALGPSRQSCPGQTLPGISSFQGHSRAFIKVQDGCQEFCSYCIIPYVRPFAASRPMAEVVAEAQRLAQAGYKELVLAGINLGRYNEGLSKLILALQEIGPVERIRLSSIEASVVDRELLALAKHGKLAPHFHLPLQSGDDHILHKMNRHYTARGFLKNLDEIKSYLNEPAITSDIMVGFPGETEEEFRHTVEVAKAAQFARTHIFPFSPRPGTRAYVLPQRVPAQVIKRRKEDLKQVTETSALEFKKKFIGKKARILVEFPYCPWDAEHPSLDPESRDEGQDAKHGRRPLGTLRAPSGSEGPTSDIQPLSGYTERYLRAQFPGPQNLRGEMVDVEITGIEEGTLQGRPSKAAGPGFLLTGRLLQ